MFNEILEKHGDILDSVANGAERVGYDRGYFQAGIAGGLALITASVAVKLINKFKKK